MSVVGRPTVLVELATKLLAILAKFITEIPAMLARCRMSHLARSEVWTRSKTDELVVESTVALEQLMVQEVFEVEIGFSDA